MNSLNQNHSSLSRWINTKKTYYKNLIELEKERITYNKALLPLPFLAWELDPVQSRYILIANKSVGIVDSFDKIQSDATLFPEELLPHRGFVRDVSWFPCDNSISAILSNTGLFNLIDMNQMKSADCFNLNLPSNCIKFDKSVGTNIGLRYCDLKSGSQVQLLKTKFEVKCIEYNPKNNHEIYTGLANGKLLVWDLRKSAHPRTEIVHPKKLESPIRTICHSITTNGTILVGFNNGDIVSYCSTSLQDMWTFSSDMQGTGNTPFATTSFEQIICPVRGKFLFINCLYGNVVETCESNVLSMPFSIIMNSINNDLLVFDSDYIGTIFRFKPQKNDIEDEL